MDIRRIFQDQAYCTEACSRLMEKARPYLLKREELAEKDRRETVSCLYAKSGQSLGSFGYYHPGSFDTIVTKATRGRLYKEKPASYAFEYHLNEDKSFIAIHKGDLAKNPYWDAAAAIDAHWAPFYGKETGKYLKEFHQLLRDCYMKYAVNAEGSARNVVYPMPELLKMEKILASAQKTVKPGTVEAQRFKLFAAPWGKAIDSVKNQLSYERPVYNVYQLLRKDKVSIDGYGKEAFWAKVKPMKLMDPKGSSTPLKYPASVKLAWDKTGVYGLFETKYPTTVSMEKDVFYNDNFEIFFSPGMGKEVEFQFVFDPLKQMFLGTKRHLPIPQPFDSFWKAPGFKLESQYGKDYWTAEFYIPFSVFKTENSVPKVYDTWHCNIVRNKTGKDREYSGTAMTLGNNHNLNMFGLIKFAGKGE